MTTLYQNNSPNDRHFFSLFDNLFIIIDLLECKQATNRSPSKLSIENGRLEKWTINSDDSLYC